MDYYIQSTQPGTRVSPSTRRESSRAGATLVELMVGSVVLTLVLAGCFVGIGQGMLISENVKSSNFATQLLQAELEVIHSLRWSDIRTFKTKDTFDPRDHFSSVPLRNYECKRLVSYLNSSQRQIRLQVIWEDLAGRKHEREFVTIYTEYGLNDYQYTAL